MTDDVQARSATDASIAASAALYAFPRNLVLAASAGTGKTHALVGVAVHLLMGACARPRGERGLRDAIRPEGLVATTFSRKAAAEIRGRLGEELGRLASGDARTSYRAGLLAACTAAGEPRFSEAELSRRAGRALAALGRAKIGTLHSFAAQIARTHALLLGLSPDFDLPDEETARERDATAIERVLEARASDPEVAALIQLVGSPAALVDLVRRALARVGEDGRRAADLEVATGDAAEIDATLRAVIGRARDLGGDARLAEPARAVVAAYDAGACGEAALEGAMGELWSVANTGRPSPAAAAFFELRESLAHASSGSRLVDRGRGLVRRWRSRDRVLPRGRAMKELLVACEAALREQNARDSVLGFTDVLRAARDVLRDHPAVAAEAGAGLEALLVDEFQDTSGVQRDLVLLLWERDRRGGELRAAGIVPTPRDLRGEGLLVVGDRKQSIYGFRGADVAVFAELSIGLAGAPARRALAIPRGLAWEPDEPTADFIPLCENRRGEPELLDFANVVSRMSLVPEREPAELYEIRYSPESEDLRSPWPRPAVDASTPRTHWLRVAVPQGKLTPPLLAEAEVMAARIGAIVRGGEATVRGAPACWRDIAILAPRHEMLAAAAYTLAEAGIPHVVAGMGFFAAAEVRDVVAMLACLVDPDDSLARAEALRGPWAGATDRALVALTDRHAGLADFGQFRTGERRFLVDAECRPAIDALAGVITALRPVAGRLGPGPALREAVRALELEETLVLLPRGEQRVANVRKLLAMADLATDGTELLRRLRRAADAEQREGEAATFSDEDDAVRLLTVHGSKGLSFPIVFLPEAGATFRSRGFEPVLLQTGVAGGPTRLVLRIQDDAGTTHDTPSYTRAKRDLSRRDAAERLRLRYVAITRASEAMYFVGDRAPPRGAKGAYDTSTASILARIAADEAFRRAAQFDVETGQSLLRRVERGPEFCPAPPPPYRRLPLALPREVVVEADSLHLAADCARRYQLDNPSRRGAASRPRPRSLSSVVSWLAGAGEWGAAVARERPRIVLSETVALVDEPPQGPSPEWPRISVLGSIDATVVWATGAVDLVSFSVPSPDPSADLLYASVLVHAARALRPAAPLRIALLGLLDGAPAVPLWLSPPDLASTLLLSRAAVTRMLSVATTDLAPRVAMAVCERAGCRHVTACHPGGKLSSEQPGRAHQTSFGFFETEARRPPRRRR